MFVCSMTELGSAERLSVPHLTHSLCVSVCVCPVCVFRVCRRLKRSRCLESCFQRWHSWHWERRASSRRYRTSVRPALLLQMLFNLYIYLNLSFLSQSLLLGCFGSRIRDYTLVLWVYVVSFYLASSTHWLTVVSAHWSSTNENARPLIDWLI